jgi:tight adherence protein B
LIAVLVAVLVCAGVSLGERVVATRRSEDALARVGAARTAGSRKGLRLRMPRPDEGPWRVFAICLGPALGWLLAGLVGAALGLVAAIVAPVLLRRRLRAKRLAALEDELAEAVSSMSAGLRAGLSVSQALAYAARESSQPLGSSLREVVDRTTLGQPLGESLDEWAMTVDLPDVLLITGVLGLHRRSGGDLPTVLDRLAETLRERRSAAREVRSLTAQARLSGAILGFLPVGFFLFLSVTSRGDVQAALSQPAGAMAIIVGFLMQAGAFLWIRTLLRVDA